MLLQIDRPEDARVFFRRSLVLYGAHEDAYFNLALCDFELGELGAARRRALQALEHDRDHSDARELLEEIAAAERASDAA